MPSKKGGKAAKVRTLLPTSDSEGPQEINPKTGRPVVLPKPRAASRLRAMLHCSEKSKGKIAMCVLALVAVVVFTIILGSLPPWRMEATKSTTSPAGSSNGKGNATTDHHPVDVTTTTQAPAPTIILVTTTRPITTTLPATTPSPAATTPIWMPPPITTTPRATVNGGPASPNILFPDGTSVVANEVSHVVNHGTPADSVVGWSPSYVETASLRGRPKRWCTAPRPAQNWSLRTCSSPLLAAQAGRVPIRLLTYNVILKGSPSSSISKLLSDASRTEPFDVMAFQECTDVRRLLMESGLSDHYWSVDARNKKHSVAIAYRNSTWQLLASGESEVAEDANWDRLRRPFLWARLRHWISGVTLFAANFRGPYPLNSGGLCGNESMAYSLLREVGLHAYAGDVKVLMGDFGAGPSSPTLSILEQYMWHGMQGSSFFGVDNVFATCATMLKNENLGSASSDHDALSITLTPAGPR